MTETRLRLFVSSPGDVADERRRVELIVERLNAEFAGRVQIQTVRWETEYYSAHETFQTQIPEAADCDLVIAIFRARLGTQLPADFPRPPSGEPYPSGTAYEVLTAIDARKAGRGLPDIFVFRDARKPLVELDAPESAVISREWERLKGFFETWFQARTGEFLAGFQTYASTDDFAHQAEDCLRKWLARQGFVSRGPVWDRILLGSPYPGLASFDAARAGIFFGRDAAIARALTRLRHAAAPFLLLIGASGAGKSSLLHAGLLPRLTAPGTIPEIDLWCPLLVVAGADPFLALAGALLESDALGPELGRGAFKTAQLLAAQLAGALPLATATLRDALDHAAAARQRAHKFETPRPARLALAIDQAERLFLEAPPATAEAFSALLAALVAEHLAYVILALRSDAYPKFQASPALLRLRETGAGFDLVAPTPVEMEEMATRPALACDPELIFETRAGHSLAATLVADAKGGDALPLLQMTLARLYTAQAARGDGVLRFADHRGMEAAVTDTADQVLQTLDAAATAELPALITGLVRDVTTDPLTGAAAPVAGALDLAAYETGNPARKILVDAFVENRLLTAEGDGATRKVRPVHEALLRIWPRAKAIVEEAANLIRVRLTLAPMVEDWRHAPPAEQPSHLELSPALLAGAQHLLEWPGIDVPPPMRDFITQAIAVEAAARDHEKHEQQRHLDDAVALAAAKSRLARRTGFGLGLALLLAALALWQWRAAETARQTAEQELAAATQTANSLVFNLAQKFEDVAGVPSSLLETVLEDVETLQSQLIQTGQTSPELRFDQAAALVQSSITLLDLGQTAQALGDATQARDILQILLAAQPGNTKWRESLAAATVNIANALGQQGQLDASIAAYRDAAQAFQALTPQDPSNLRWQEEASNTQARLADKLEAAGNLPAALSAAQAAQAVAKTLTTEAPSDSAYQQELQGIDSMIGNILIAQGHVADALNVLTEAQTIDRTLVAEDITNTAWQGALANVDDDLGRVQETTGKTAAALASFRAAQAINQTLADSDPANTGWQTALAQDGRDVGDALIGTGDTGHALAAYQSAKAIDQALTVKDSTNTDAKANLATDDDDVGGVLQNQGDLTGALTQYQAAKTMNQALLAGNKSDTDWQTGLTIDDRDIGLLLEAQKKPADALAAFQEAQRYDQALSKMDPTNTDWLSALASDGIDIGDAMSDQNNLAGALTALQAAQTAATALAARDAANTGWQEKLAYIDTKIADLLNNQHNPGAAIPAYRQAASILAALAQKNPQDSDDTAHVVRLDNEVASLLAARNDLNGECAAYRAVQTFIASLPTALAAAAPQQTALAAAYRDAGGVLDAQSNEPAALGEYQAAHKIDLALLSKDATNITLQDNAATDDEDIAGIMLDQNNLPGQAAALREAAALNTQLAAEDPNNPQRKSTLADDDADLAWDAIVQNQPQQALDLANQSINLASNQIWMKGNKADALMMLGQSAAAQTIYLRYKSVQDDGLGHPWTTDVLADFDALQKLGHAYTLMSTIEAAFK